ncbi:MAG: CinA family nicotinamide mononucleotide deamidase-related protein [Chloroflexi bacterium]|nr:CinA family nicotinamide mononucleotide deamidase-related protein [Chloroflexota bacterium]
MEAEIITIGTELLLGEIVDANSRTIARALREIGLDLYRTTTVGDNVERIAQVVKESAERAQAVITTGGLGPTVDDPTREAMSIAFSSPLEFKPELWEEIIERFSRYGTVPSENNKQQAFIPRGAIVISNPVGTAPAFIIETPSSVVIALPGVPAELAVLLESDVIPYLRKKLKLRQIIKTRILRTAGIGESWLDNKIEDLERMSNPTVGLAAHPGLVDIRITAKGPNSAAVDEMIWKMEATIRQRLGDHIYASDQTALEDVIIEQLEEKGWKLLFFELGTNAVLEKSFAGRDSQFRKYAEIDPALNVKELPKLIQETIEDQQFEVGLGIHLSQNDQQQFAEIFIHLPDEVKHISKTYGGPRENAPKWAAALALSSLRRKLH